MSRSKYPGKNTKSPKPTPSSGDTAPRFGHYAFAHRVLPPIVHHHPLMCVGMLASPESQLFLQHILDLVKDRAPDTAEVEPLLVEQITIHRTRIGNFPCAILQLPQPERITEAFFVAIVLLADTSDNSIDPEMIRARYFTLELGFSLDGSQRTVLCEWTADASHVNFGTGPSAVLTEFVAAVQEHING